MFVDFDMARPESSTSNDSMDVSTLIGSTELRRKDLMKQQEARTTLNEINLQVIFWSKADLENAVGEEFMVLSPKWEANWIRILSPPSVPRSFRGRNSRFVSFRMN